MKLDGFSRDGVLGAAVQSPKRSRFGSVQAAKKSSTALESVSGRNGRNTKRHVRLGSRQREKRMQLAYSWTTLGKVTREVKSSPCG